ncbi:hypothetical protein G9A89_006857 [Geosiphon pyriformis]|nr:hypothetical protein G9A89_006857 [Geosiphon pyriformis]
MNKFDGFWVFTFGLDSGYMGSGVAIVMNISLVRHVCKVSEVLEIRVEHSIENSLPGRIPAIKLRKKLTKLQFWEATDKTIIIESLSIIQRTQPNPLNTNLQTQIFRLLSIATRFEYQNQHQHKFKSGRIRKHRRLNHNHILVESAFNFYVNKRIVYLLGTPVNIKSAREAFYSELIQNTNLPINHNFAFIITEINKEIEHHTQQRYSITYARKGKRKLQTPTVILKRIQPPTWKKTRVEFSTNPSYHYTSGSAINITSTSMATSNMTSAFG